VVCDQLLTKITTALGHHEKSALQAVGGAAS
jgi:hypothetical protein